MKKRLYPGLDEVEKQRQKKTYDPNEDPDFIGNAPNYDKFYGWSAERVLTWLNID